MSKWYPCIYCTEDLHCTKFTQPGYKSWCVLGPCTAETPSVGDMFRRMSDEEIAEYMASKETALTDLIFLKVQAELKKKGLLIDFSSRFHPDLLKQRDWWLDYLKQEAPHD